MSQSQKCNCFAGKKRKKVCERLQFLIPFMSEIVYLHEEIFGVLVSLVFEFLFAVISYSSPRNGKLFCCSMHTTVLFKQEKNTLIDSGVQKRIE